jgi:hypothetical protein
MPFEYRGWRLYLREVKLRNKKPITIYYFSKKTPESGSPTDIPLGKAMAVHAKTGYPVLTAVDQSATETGVRGQSFEGWVLYEGDVRDEDTGQMVRVSLFCQSRPKGFAVVTTLPPGQRPAWHPVTGLPCLGTGP